MQLLLVMTSRFGTAVLDVLGVYDERCGGDNAND